MSDESLPQSEIILYQTEDCRTRTHCRLENETLWLTQALIGELFEKDVRTINEHLANIFDERELQREATIRKFRIVRTEGKREGAREIEHYNLDAIRAVGFRVRSHRGTQFRQWAIGRLNEYLVKGFTMDDERLKNPLGKGQKDYFDEQPERIRRALIEADLVDCMVALPGQLFSSTQIPVCLWFLAKNKNADAKRSFYDRRLQADAGLAAKLTTMENKA